MSKTIIDNKPNIFDTIEKLDEFYENSRNVISKTIEEDPYYEKTFLLNLYKNNKAIIKGLKKEKRRCQIVLDYLFNRVKLNNSLFINKDSYILANPDIDKEHIENIKNLIYYLKQLKEISIKISEYLKTYKPIYETNIELYCIVKLVSEVCNNAIIQYEEKQDSINYLYSIIYYSGKYNINMNLQLNYLINKLSFICQEEKIRENNNSDTIRLLKK